jgi:hypothetical protein
MFNMPPIVFEWIVLGMFMSWSAALLLSRFARMTFDHEVIRHLMLGPIVAFVFAVANTAPDNMNQGVIATNAIAAVFQVSE